MGMASGGDNRRTMSDINVTPLVDVMLVLLIIFMVTAPMMEQGVKVDLPRTRAPMVESDENKLVLTITKERKIFLGDREIPYTELVGKLKYNPRVQQEGELYLHADRGLDYGFVVDVMARVQDAGVLKMGMITNPSGTPDDPER